MDKQNNKSTSEQIEIRRAKLHDLQARGKDPFVITKYERTNLVQDIKSDYNSFVGKNIKLVGRIMAKRGMGKVNFSDLMDSTGKIQVYTRKDVLGDDAYEDWKKLDIGDIVGVSGEVMLTEAGEITLRNMEYVLLAKALRPLPDKFHGLQDVELRCRQRYVDLIANQDVKDTFVKRSLLIREIRRFMDGRNFLEVETPILNVIAGGASARPFVTHHNALDIDMYLRIAPELYLKRLIIGGFDRVYEIGRNFRNEGIDNRHNPEFTMMELYQSYTDLFGMMELAESLISHLALKLYNSTKVMWENKEVDLTPPFRRLTMLDAIKQFSGEDFHDVKDFAVAKEIAAKHQIEVLPSHGLGDIINSFFEKYVEENLEQPTFIYDYPLEISPLTKKKPGQPNLTERFELFIHGKEFGNAYSELNDPEDQRERFALQAKKREAGDDEANIIDEDFCEALEYGMPPTGGLGIGIDRLCMLLTNKDSIREVLLFPTMKILNNTAKTETAEQTTAVAQTPVKLPETIDFSKVKIEPLFADFVDFDTFSKSDLRAVKVKACVAVPKSKKLLQFTLDDGTETDRTILSGIHAFYEPEELVGKTLLAIVNLPARAMMGIESCGMLLSAIHMEDEKEKLQLIMLDDHIPAGAKLY